MVSRWGSRRNGAAPSVGPADSLTPSTIGPALYLATGRKRAWRVAQFTSAASSARYRCGAELTWARPGYLRPARARDLASSPLPRSRLRAANT
jgi:hypothetical protein